MKNFLETINCIEIRETGKCSNCGKETKYYNTEMDKYICCIDCGEELFLYLDDSKKQLIEHNKRMRNIKKVLDEINESGSISNNQFEEIENYIEIEDEIWKHQLLKII